MTKRTKAERERDAALEAEAVEVELEVEEDRRIARRTFIVATVTALLLSLGANLVSRYLTDALEGTAFGQRLADFVFVLPVLAATWLMHAVLTLNKVGSTVRAHRQRFREESRLFQIVTVAAASFCVAVTVVSYKHQLAVAHWAGMNDWSAHIFPIAIDGVLAIAAASLFVLRAASKADMRTAVARAMHHNSAPNQNPLGTRKPQVNGAYLGDIPSVPQPANLVREPKVNPEPEVREPLTKPEPKVRVPGTPPAADLVREPARPTQGEVHGPARRTQVEPQTVVREPLPEHLEEARELGNGTKVDLGTLTHILAGLDEGVGIKPLARDLGVQHGVVRRIRDKRLDRRPHLVQAAV